MPFRDRTSSSLLFLPMLHGVYSPGLLRSSPDPFRLSARPRGLQPFFTTPYFRVYVSSDPTGVQIGGALKNVIAIAAGVVDGLDLGANSRAALITRGLAEITRLGVAMGGKLQ